MVRKMVIVLAAAAAVIAGSTFDASAARMGGGAGHGGFGRMGGFGHAAHGGFGRMSGFGRAAIAHPGHFGRSLCSIPGLSMPIDLPPGIDLPSDTTGSPTDGLPFSRHSPTRTTTAATSVFGPGWAGAGRMSATTEGPRKRR